MFGTKFVLIGFSYTDVVLTGSAGDTISVPGTFSLTFVTPMPVPPK
jgi:hypothetical protein